MEMTEGRPDREDERVEGLAAEPCLCAVPNAGHDSAVQRTPYAEYRAEGGTNIRREDDVVLRPGVGVGGEEEAGERVADPDGEPTLPPGHAQGNAGRGDHERAARGGGRRRVSVAIPAGRRLLPTTAATGKGIRRT